MDHKTPLRRPARLKAIGIIASMLVVTLFFIAQFVPDPQRHTPDEYEMTAIAIRDNGTSLGVCQNKPGNEFYSYNGSYWLVWRGQIGHPYLEWCALEVLRNDIYNGMLCRS